MAKSRSVSDAHATFGQKPDQATANIADSILEKRVISPAMADKDTKCRIGILWYWAKACEISR